MHASAAFVASLLAIAPAFALANAHDAEKRAPHAAVAEKQRLMKRYPPDRTTFAITTTPAYEATSVVPALGTAAAPLPTGAFQNRTYNPLAATPTTCAPTYTAPETITGTGTLPKPSTFVRKDPNSQALQLDGTPFTIVGPNIYWICQDENVSPPYTYTNKIRVREALAMAVAMGANTIRLHSCGISTGTYGGFNLFTLQPNRFKIQPRAWDIRDYVLFAAREYGLRVVLPLTDNYRYYHGGKYDFLGFVPATSQANGGAQFYTNRAVITYYIRYITALLTHVNTYTGVRWADDPTILAWETGNELGGYIESEMWPPTSWTNTIISTIRTYDSNHLIIDGTNGFWNYTTGATSPGLDNPGIDIVSDHGYPRNTGLINKEYSLSSPRNKNFLIGEFDWTVGQSSLALATYLAQIESWKPNVGDLAWSLFGHDAQCCNFVKHNDGYSIYYPNGNTAEDTNNVLLLVQHWYRMTNRSPPSQLLAVTCPQPVF